MYSKRDLGQLFYRVFVLFAFINSIGCTHDSLDGALFISVPSTDSGLDFSNTLTPTTNLNCYTYKNFYNGGGVALADFNNDNRIDIFLTGNQVSNRLYLNQGDLVFVDATEFAGLTSTGIWSSGASAADVDGDGDIDLFVSKSGAPVRGARYNQLFLNNGLGEFSDVSEQTGLQSIGLSTQATFFDADADGDLDLYLLNNSLRSVGGYDLRPGQRDFPDSLGGNKFYLNRLSESGRLFFEDATEASGIYASAIGFGLGVVVSDFDEDSDLDIYVCNDFFERDYLYLNDGNATFTETLPSRITTTSLGSMGADAGDLNGDGHLDLIVTDMLPSDSKRYKSATRFDTWSTYASRVRSGYHHQVTRNTVQLNWGDGSFSEIGRQLGLQSSDWSWGALMFDVELDGDTDIFISNGIGKDLTDQDYIHFDSNPKTIAQRMRRGDTNAILELLDQMPSVPIPNVLFTNDGELGFEERGASLGVAGPGFSNGAAYADLDNDGDLDLVVNNVNAPVSLFENKATNLFPGHHFVGIELSGKGLNSKGIGARVEVYVEDKVFVQEIMPSRGFQSSGADRLVFGIGKSRAVDSVLIMRHGYAAQRIKQVNIDAYNTIQLLDLSADLTASSTENTPGHLQEPIFNWKHIESNFSDFDLEHFKVHMGSTSGPAAASADINEDGSPDFFLGGAAGQPSTLHLSGVHEYSIVNIEGTEEQEATAAMFFDADQDGDFDLYLANGSSEFAAGDERLQDQLFINSDGQFTQTVESLPTRRRNSTSIEQVDVDHDGDLDLLIGESPSSGEFGMPCDLRLLINENGKFRETNSSVQQMLSGLGMITDLAIVEKSDTSTLVVVVGEWMPITFVHFRPQGNIGIDVIQNSDGWYQSVMAIDLNGNGKNELLLGNLGHNSPLSTHKRDSFILERGDFDGDGAEEAIISRRTDQGDDPVGLLPDFYKSMPALREAIPRFSAFAKTTSDELLNKQNRMRSTKSHLKNTSSCIAEATPAGWKLTPLPFALQSTPTYALNAFFTDENQYIIAMGNLLSVRPEIGPYLTSRGSLIKVNEEGQAMNILNPTCLEVEGEIRHILGPFGTNQRMLIVRNNDSPVWWDPTKCNLP